MAREFWSLKEAIETILDSGVSPTNLSHELGFNDTSMVYRYKKGQTAKTTAIRAKTIHTSYGMLLDDYTSLDHLNTLTQAELDKGGKMPTTCQHLMKELLAILSYDGVNLRPRLLRFVADHDKRAENVIY